MFPIRAALLIFPFSFSSLLFVFLQFSRDWIFPVSSDFSLFPLPSARLWFVCFPSLLSWLFSLSSILSLPSNTLMIVPLRSAFTRLFVFLQFSLDCLPFVQLSYDCLVSVINLVILNVRPLSSLMIVSMVDRDNFSTIDSPPLTAAIVWSFVSFRSPIFQLSHHFYSTSTWILLFRVSFVISLSTLKLLSSIWMASS